MNVKRLALASVGVYVVYQALAFLLHQVLLAETYARLASVWRPEAEMMSKMPVMFATSAVWSVIFCYMFVKGRETGGAMEGLRFGLVIGVFVGLPWAYESWVLYPLPLSLAHAWAASTLVITAACGITCSLLYAPRA